MKRCDNGHYFDENKHTSCPACGVNVNLGRTVPRPNPVAGTPVVPPNAVLGGTRRMDTPSVPPPIPGTPAQQGKTIALYKDEVAGIDPVVGWLVCIEGPDRGHDYRLKAERNFIGRGSTNHICIVGDQTISREKHAIISFNPKTSSFRLLPGDSSGLVYLNEEEVDMARSLHAFDTIELGRTKLRFVPFCGTHFSWSDALTANPADGGDSATS